MDRDSLIKELRSSGASWPALALVYVFIVAAFVLTGMAIT